ncbi:MULTISPECIES: STAS domain-containing protein [unclassified Streptomyces]|uniref:STAS domain-containing protein n=1 Tax=unclassified Streptomyces TaxID=2593676 RepID=UPI002E17478E|nr:MULTISPECIES: STAS domain-containing protein [unclassified Streptomyces]
MAGTYDTTDMQQRLIIQDTSTEQYSVLVQLADVILRLAGELDYLTAPTLCDTVAHIMAAGHRHLFLDLSAITWCDNASLYTLLGIRSAPDSTSAPDPERPLPSAGVTGHGKSHSFSVVPAGPLGWSHVESQTRGDLHVSPVQLEAEDPSGVGGKKQSPAPAEQKAPPSCPGVGS